MRVYSAADSRPHFILNPLGLLLVIVKNTDQGKNGVLGQKEMKLRFEPSDPSEEAAPRFKFFSHLVGLFCCLPHPWKVLGSKDTLHLFILRHLQELLWKCALPCDGPQPWFPQTAFPVR